MDNKDLKDNKEIKEENNIYGFNRKIYKDTKDYNKREYKNDKREYKNDKREYKRGYRSDNRIDRWDNKTRSEREKRYGGQPISSQVASYNNISFIDNKIINCSEKINKEVKAPLLSFIKKNNIKISEIEKIISNIENNIIIKQYNSNDIIDVIINDVYKMEEYYSIKRKYNTKILIISDRGSYLYSKYNSILRNNSIFYYNNIDSQSDERKKRAYDNNIIQSDILITRIEDIKNIRIEYLEFLRLVVVDYASASVESVEKFLSNNLFRKVRVIIIYSGLSSEKVDSKGNVYLNINIGLTVKEKGMDYEEYVSRFIDQGLIVLAHKKERKEEIEKVFKCAGVQLPEIMVDPLQQFEDLRLSGEKEMSDDEGWE